MAYQLPARETKMVTLGAEEGPVVLVSEAGFYQLLLWIPVVANLGVWVANQVMPSIREKGRYDSFDPTTSDEELLFAEKGLDLVRFAYLEAKQTGTLPKGEIIEYKAGLRLLADDL